MVGSKEINERLLRALGVKELDENEKALEALARLDGSKNLFEEMLGDWVKSQLERESFSSIILKENKNGR